MLILNILILILILLITLLGKTGFHADIIILYGFSSRVILDWCIIKLVCRGVFLFVCWKCQSVLIATIATIATISIVGKVRSITGFMQFGDDIREGFLVLWI